MAAVLDANAILAEQRSKQRKTDVELNGPLEAAVDLALLAVFDPNELVAEEYNHDKEAAIHRTARNGVQLLINKIFNQPTKVTMDGVYASIPKVPSTTLPREKPLPKPKPETKWQKFAKSKGIAPKPKRDRMVFDEERQDWVPAWGYKGKNKQVEEQWATEVPANADASFDASKVAKEERKARKLKNESQRLKNVERATQAALRQSNKSSRERSGIPAGLAALESSGPSSEGQAGKKADLARLLKSTRTATASLGKFDNTLDKEETIIGKKGSRGQKRKFEPNEVSASAEKESALKMLKTLGKDDAKSRAKIKERSDNPVNARKAIRELTKGKGVTSLSEGRNDRRKPRK